MIKYIHILILILSVSQVFAEPFQVAVIRRGLNNANFGPVQRVYENFVSALDKSDAFKVNNNIDLDKTFGIPITPDFAQIIDPVNLYDLNKKSKVQIVVFFQASATDVVVTFVEFPSGIQLNSRTIPYSITNTERLEKDLTAQIDMLGNILPENSGEYGFDFNPSDFGIVVCTDDIHNIDLAKTLDQVNRQFFKNIRLSMGRTLKNKIIESNNMTCDEMSALCKDLNAELVFCFSTRDRGRQQVAFAFNTVPRVLAQTEYPMLPEKTGLACYTSGGGQYDAEKVASILVGESAPPLESTDLLGLYLYRVLRMHRDWKMGLQRSANLKQVIFTDYQNIDRVTESQSLQKAWISLNYAAFSGMVRDFTRADSLLTNALGLFLLHYETTGEILCRLEQAKQLILQEKWTDADNIYTRLLKKQSTQIDSTSEAEINYSLGLINEGNGNPEAAINYYENSLTLFARLKDSYRAMTPQLKMGQLYRKVGDYIKAEDSINRYLAIANTLHSEPDIARARYEMGLVRLADNKLDEALKNFTMAGEMFDMLGEKQYQAYIQLNMGVIYFKKGQYVKANLSLNKAREMAAEIHEIAVEIDSYRYLGDTESEMENWDRAQGNYDTAIDLAIENGYMDRVAELMYIKGLSHLKQGNVMIGYTEVKKGIELSDGKVYGDRKQADAFLKKLEKIIAQKNQKLINQ